MSKSNKHTLRVTYISVEAVSFDAGCLFILLVYLNTPVKCLDRNVRIYIRESVQTLARSGDVTSQETLGGEKL